MKHNRFLRWSGFLLPYAAVGIGVYAFKSAWIAIGIYYFGIVLFVAACGGRRLLGAVSKGWGWGTGVLLSSVFFLSGAAVFVLWPFAKLEGIEIGGVLGDFGLAPTTGIVFAVVAVAVNPLLEELFWRGCFEDKVTRVSVIDIAFAGYHGLALMLVIRVWAVAGAFIVLCFASWVLRYVTDRCGGLAVPYIAHLAADISIVAGVYCLLR